MKLYLDVQDNVGEASKRVKGPFPEEVVSEWHLRQQEFEMIQKTLRNESEAAKPERPR